jgi:hypothetical protein
VVLSHIVQCAWFYDGEKTRRFRNSTQCCGSVTFGTDPDPVFSSNKITDKQKKSRTMVEIKFFLALFAGWWKDPDPDHDTDL